MKTRNKVFPSSDETPGNCEDKTKGSINDIELSDMENTDRKMMGES